jgi:hypothetical protein
MKPIYLYHLTQNGVPRYVGVTTQISVRKSFWKRTKPPHTFEIVDTFTDKQEAGIAEQYHIAGYKTFINGWNKSDGGETLLDGKNHPRYIDGRTSDWNAYCRALKQTPKYKAKQREYEQRAERKAKKKEYRDRNKAKAQEYRDRPEVKERKKEYMRAYRARKKNENKNTCESAPNKKQ